MKQENGSKLFAFKLADKHQQQVKTEQKWQVRDGVATAGCTGPDVRATSNTLGLDKGIYC